VTTVDEIKETNCNTVRNFLEIKDLTNSETGNPTAVIQFTHITALEHLAS
jgi:hypothetical protein